MIDFPKPAIILPAPKEIIRPGDPRFFVPEMASFLPGMMPGMGSRLSGPVAITQTAQPAGVAGTANVVTYTGIAIGDAHPTRIVCLLVGSELASCTINSATMDNGGGAVAMNSVAQGSFGALYARLFYLLDTSSATTATFAITFGANPSATQNTVAVYRTIFAASTPLNSGSDGNTDFNGTPLSTGSITIPTNGGFLGIASGAAQGATKTWANATEDLDLTASAFRFTTAYSTTPGSVTITCQSSSAGDDGGMSWIVFNPY